MEWEFFKDVPGDDVEQLLSAGIEVWHRRNQPVFKQGAVAHQVHLIRSGRFAVRASTRRGTVTLAILGPGETFGELALVGEEPRRSAEVMALEDGATLEIDRRDLKQVRAAHPAIDRAISSILAHQVRRLSDQLLEAHYLDAPTRIRRRLASLASMYDEGGDSITIPVTHEILAELAGTSRQAVSTVLGEERQRGAVAQRRGSILVLDRQSLRESLG